MLATFAAGASSATIQVPIIDENEFECDEIFQAAILVPGDITGAKVTKGTENEAQVTIRDKGVTVIRVILCTDYCMQVYCIHLC